MTDRSTAERIAEIEAAGEAVIESIPSDYRQLTEDVADLQDAVESLGDEIDDLDTGLAAKVNKPTTSPNGTSGQVLRTNGDGTTTWVDVGTPTDAQTATAVSAWLDNHPEATTTVQDGAITYAKLNSALQAIVDDAKDVKDYVKSIVVNPSNDKQLIVTDGNGTDHTIDMKGGVDFSELHLSYTNSYLHILDEDNQDVTDPVEIVSSELAGVEYDENYYLHFYDKNGEELYDGPFFIQGGGGGGGSSAITLTNVVKVTTVRNGADAIFGFTATSSDDTDITVRWFVDGVHVGGAGNVSGSTFTFNAGPYLRPSDSSVVKAEITSEGGGSLSRQWTVTSTAFSLSWGAAIQPITLYTANENIYAVVNVTAQAGTSNIVTVSVGEHEVERTVSGSASITVELNKSWFEVGANTVTAEMVSSTDETDEADPIHFIALWGYGAEDPIVAFADDSVSGTQFDIVNVRYFAYDPESETATCELQIGEETPRTISAERAMRVLRYAPSDYGTITVTLTCGESEATMTLLIAESEYNIGKVTGDSLRYDLDPMGHSNADADREEFGDMTFSQGFDWVNGGFQTDADGAPAFVVKKGHRATLPRSLFADSDANGKVIDVSFRVTNSDQYDAVAMQDLNNSNTKGLILKANEGELRLDNAAGQVFRYCEENRIDLSVHVEDVTAQRLVTIWLDGIPSKTDPYETNTLVHSEHNMVIGSDHCDVWVYAIRVYNAKLSMREMIQNYISLGSTTAAKVARCQANDIFDANGKITPASLHAASPTLTIVEISADRMTVNKKDKVPADIQITDGTTVLVLNRANGTVFMVQGTSSAAYGRSNYNLDMDFKNTGLTYKLSTNAIPVNYLNIKVNVASSENANNINAVDWYNTFQPYLTEPRSRTGVRDTVEGKPCAVFFTNTSETAQWFSSQLVQPGETILYAMGDLCNSKKNKAVFGQDGSGTHPTKACIEVSGNDTACQRFRSAAAVYNTEDGEWQTTRTEGGQTIVTTEYEWRMEPDDDDLSDVVQAWDDLVTWVVSTIGDDEKFKDEIGDYFAVDSLLYHFLFLEFFSAYDNVSKNTFYSYDWDDDAQKYLWNIKCAYDWDTIIASDNDGKPFGDYGLDYGDTIDGTPGGRSYFNAVDNPIWVNIQSAFQDELSQMYISLRSEGAWSSADILTKWDTYQAKRPHAAMAQDAYNKYVLPYKTTGVVIDGQTLAYDDSYLPRLQGSKTYQRRQFMSYQADYMDGKYGYYSKSVGTQFRTNCASTTEDFTIKAYAKTYLTVIVDNNKVDSRKVEAGGTVTFENVSVGTNTTLYFTPDRLIQYIRPLNETQNSTFAASGAAKLMEAILGGETANTAWLSGTGLSVPSALLQDLSIRNMTNFSSALDLASNVSLETLDTRGTNTGRITLPSYAPLETIQLNACTGLVAYNLNDVETFTMASGSNLLNVRIENCNAVIMNAMKTYLMDAVGTLQYLRMIGVDWTLSNTALLNFLLTVGSIDASGLTGSAPCVLTGSVYVPELRSSEKAAYEAAWPDLTVSYAVLIPQYTVTFLNYDDSPILDKQGNAYTQNVDSGENAYDPIEADEINIPTRPSTQQYSYTFDDWDRLPTGVIRDMVVHATYTSTIQSYTVTVEDGIPGSGEVLATYTNQSYGSCVDLSGLHPTFTSREQAQNLYYVHAGWDKSTGFITGNTTVKALWVQGNMPFVEDAIPLSSMNWAEISAIAKNGLGDSYWEPDESFDFELGHGGSDMDFANVESETLISTPTYFDGGAPMIFNGENDLPSIQLFNGSIDRWTLAIDYECTGDSGSLVSCFSDNGNEGFQFRRTGNYTNILWGDKNQNMGYQYQRGIMVIRYNRGQYPLVLYMTGDGNLQNGEYPVNTAKPEGNVETNAHARSVATETNAPLTFGGVGYMNGSDATSLRGTGWIHWAKIWYDDIGVYNAASICAMPHIPAKYAYTQIAYRDGLDSPTLIGASFQCKGLLPLRGRINYTGTNVGGWRDSHRRAWLNGQYFAGLPYPLQAMIVEARVRFTEGGGSSSTHALNRISCMDKVYLPAYAEAFASVTGNNNDNIAYIDECDDSAHRIPGFTYDSSRGQSSDNNTRVRFCGFTLEGDENFVVSASDPTTPGLGYTVHSEKTVWINTSNSSVGYLYVDADYIAKHKFVGGRLVSSTDNKDASGADSDGHSGGKWIAASSWWLRSPNVTNSTNFWYVGSYGSSYNATAHNTFGLSPAFSIENRPAAS